MKHSKLLILIFTLLCLGSCNEASKKEEATTLSFKFPPGSVYAYLMDSHQTIEQEVMGKASTITQSMQMLSTYHVEKADGNKRKLTVVYDRFYIKSSSSGSEMEYDSADSSKQPKELSQIADIVNHPFSLLVSEKGEILSVNPSAAAGRNADSGRRDAAAETPLNDSTIRRMMEQSLNIYPSTPVKVGDSWERKYTTNMGFMDMAVTSTYRLVSVSNDVAHIEIVATIKSIPSSNPQMKGMDIEMTGTQDGTMDIDVKSGLIQESKFTQNVIGKMKIPGAEIPMKLTSDTRIIGKMK
jgi:hypothetical protein